MLVIALTGGLGAGKSTAAEFFRERGAVVVSLDDVAHRVLDPGSPALSAVVEEFGEGVLHADGTLDRAELARMAFATRDTATRLNAIVHPAVAREVGPSLRELDMLPMKPEVVVLEVPLLAEAPVFREIADDVLAIEASVESRVSRSIARGMSEADARRRIACQATDEDRRALADDVIVNDAGKDAFLSELERFWELRVGPWSSGRR